MTQDYSTTITDRDQKARKAIREGLEDEYIVFKIPAWLAAENSHQWSETYFEENYPEGVLLAGKIDKETEDAYRIRAMGTLPVEDKAHEIFDRYDDFSAAQHVEELLKEVREEGEFSLFEYQQLSSMINWIPKSQMEVIE